MESLLEQPNEAMLSGAISVFAQPGTLDFLLSAVFDHVSYYVSANRPLLACKMSSEVNPASIYMPFIHGIDHIHSTSSTQNWSRSLNLQAEMSLSLKCTETANNN
eukprot:scaffold295762_cov41-Prasinocladus_malaysianus.AAC.1